MKYFAYGSNMDRTQMKERCPDSKLIGKAVLHNYKIAFTIFSPKRQCGCADILSSVNSEVWGLLYDISEKDLENLDIAECHPDKYKRFQVVVEDVSGEEYTVETYEVVKKEGAFLKPSKHYLGLMQEAAREFDFPEKYQEMLKMLEHID